MSLIMPENSPPVFRDFLGAGQRAEMKRPEISMTSSVRISENSAACEDGEISTRPCFKYSSNIPRIGARPISLPDASDPTSEGWRHFKSGVAAHRESKFFSYKDFEHDYGKQRDVLSSSDLLRKPLQLNSEVLESSRPSKVSRFSEKEDTRRGHRDGDPSSLSGDFSLSMQPPRALASGSAWIQTSVINNDLSKRMESSIPTGLNSRITSVGLNIAIASGGNPPQKENAIGISLPEPPADEGSRTGLQGKGIAHLLNRGPSKSVMGDSIAPDALFSQSQAPPWNAVASGSDLPSLDQNAASATRQLTVFYGGQAHVFDDVSSEKVDAIMLLAGSSGRSWSTTYAHPPSANNPSTARDGGELGIQKSNQGAVSMKEQGRRAFPSDIRSSSQRHAGVGAQPGNQYRHQELTAALASPGLI